MSKIVAIIGRPNVGKSTLFNRLIEEQKAIVDDFSGVTRDRNYGTVKWNGIEFTVIDTGGYVVESDDTFERAIREQVHIAMEEADVLIFMVDVQTGVNPLDEAFANIVRQQPKKLIVAANKSDTHEISLNAYDFYELGLPEIIPISAANGAGTGDLLDRVVEMMPDKNFDPPAEGVPRFAVVGRPNVGKSSFVNALLGRDENIVTPIAGTTRDSIYTRYTAFNQDLYLVDTAGLRKKAKVQNNIEFYSTLRTIRAIENCDIALLMIDASQGIESQDLYILGQIQKNRKGIVILVNKWDLLEKETNTARDFAAHIREKMAPMVDVPIIFISVHEKQRLIRALETAQKVFENKERKIPTHELNEVMQTAVAQHHPPAVAGRIIRIKYVTQIPASNPTFLFFTNHPKHVRESYKRYLENQIRKNFNFTGVPLNIFFRKK